VHGDTQPTFRELNNTAARLRDWTRRSLLGFLRLNGDQGRLVAAVEDAAVRAANRTVVSR
jgi:hypothetical protein